jgi:hypothetical protein
MSATGGIARRCLALRQGSALDPPGAIWPLDPIYLGASRRTVPRQGWREAPKRLGSKGLSALCGVQGQRPWPFGRLA